MDTILASLGIFAGAALFVGPPILIIWGLAVILNRPGGKQKQDDCPYVEEDVYGNARIMKKTYDANVAAFEAEQQPAYGRGHETPSYKAPAPLAIEAPRVAPGAPVGVPATAHQVNEVPLIDQWLAAGQVLQDVYAELPAHQSTALLPSGDVVDGEWIELPRQAILVNRNR